MKKISIIEANGWEVASSWWAKFVTWKWAQNLAACYFAWKVGRKWRNYEAHHNRVKRLEELTGEAGYSIHSRDCPYEHGGACTCR
jgi:hypothetical protein